MSGALLEVQSLSVAYGRQLALDAVSLQIAAGETLAVVGESGSGKSTLARAVLRLVAARAGSVRFQGEELLTAGAARLRALRRGMQMVFQNPQGSLDPRMRIGPSVAEPLWIHEPALSSAARAARAAAALEQVGLPSAMAARYPHELSGGQCQRVAIARAMIAAPRLLICDEAVSALDVSVQGQIVNLLLDLQQSRGLALLFISHNLALVRQISHRILVMYRGRAVETGTRDALLAAPQHAHTRQLFTALSGLEDLLCSAHDTP